MGFDTYTPQRLLSPKNSGEPLPAVEPDRFDYPTESNGFMARAATAAVAPTETAFYEGPLSVQQRVYDEYNFSASAKQDK
ncbi:MAG: hypothetical protein KVP17_005004 [Porospora cf. gigantea B]|nr:MAG: hypothetical protein KVP17_005004 [Porospora cf. gigantea B]